MIYLLEDDDSIRDFVIYTLVSQGMEARGFDRPSAFWAGMEESVPSLVLLDIMLPEEDGMSVLKKLRESPRTRKLPVIMLTAKSTEYDKVMGLDAGADDYIAKPFGMMELLSRIRALLRRTEADSGVYRCGELTVDPGRHTVTVGGQNVALTQKEFEVLCLLLKNRGQVLSREQLIENVWGYAFTGESRTVDVHVRTLRQKLGTAGLCGNCPGLRLQDLRGIRGGGHDETNLPLHPGGVRGGAAGVLGAHRGRAPRIFPEPGHGGAEVPHGVCGPRRGAGRDALFDRGTAGGQPGHLGGRPGQRAL